MSGAAEEADRVDRARAALDPPEIPRTRIAAYVRNVVASLEPAADAAFDQHA